MIDINDITLRFGGRLLFDGASAHISDGQRVGLTGRNGTGKTTLFKMIQGLLPCDDGEIRLTKGQKLASVAQEIPDGDISLLDCVLQADTERTALLKALDEAEKADDGVKIGEIHERLNVIGAASAESRAASILYGLGFSEENQKRPVSSFSGGWRMRVALAAALFVPSDVLLLDEPTNHLDLEATLWLENYLSRYAGTLVVISHDRSLLNHLCDHILHIEGLKIISYGGNYSAFEQTRALQRENEQKQAEKTEEARKHLQEFVDRFRYKASKAKQAQSRVKMLEKLPPKTVFINEAETHFSFPSPNELPSPLIKIEDGAVGYDGTPVLSRLNLRIDADDRIALLGANGNGKSTFAKLLAGKLTLMSGTMQMSSKLQVGYYAQHQTEELSTELTAYEQLRQTMKDATETQVRAHLGRFGLTQQKADTKIAQLSGGEKARLLFAMMSRNAPHILLLDEPTNHLDIDARDALVEAVNGYRGAVILITHDPNLIELTADRLWLIDGGRCKAYDGDLNDYRALLAEKAKVQAAGNTPKADTPAVSRKDERREAAEKRQQLAPIRKKVKELEARLEKLNDQRDQIMQLLEDPTMYMIGLNGQKVRNLQITLAQLDAEIEAAENDWLEQSALLDL